ncbi:MAG: DUF1844 domain-containing protein [Candidatus Binatia bacterium]
MSNEEERQEKRGFKVEDRRRFSEDGDVRPEPQVESGGPAVREGPAAAGGTATSAPASERREAPPLPLTFATFVLSLSTQALAHLGEIPNPIDNRIATDLLAAKQMIDILGILREKTKGNLDSSESGLLDNVLYDLRLKYVERVRSRS